MKKLFLLSAVCFASIGFISCEQCATCTTLEDDPEAVEEIRTDEICGRGREFTDQREVYERTNWECVDN